MSLMGVILISLPVQEAIFGRMDGPDFLVSRGVSAVAIHTGVALTGAPTQVPIAVHSAVSPLGIVAVLNAVALGAKLHGLIKFNFTVIGQMQNRTVLVVTGSARKTTVMDLQPTVKVFWCVLDQGRLGSRAVAAGARNSDGSITNVLEWCI
jgi:hypothetical protein